MISDTMLFSLVVMLLILLLGIAVLRLGHSTGESHSEKFETRRLYFAAVVLTGLGLIFLESMGIYYFGGDESDIGKEIFDACKTIIPPIVTLVLGYYFGKTDDSGPPSNLRGVNPNQSQGSTTQSATAGTRTTTGGATP